MLCRHCPDSFLSRHENLSGYSTNDNGTELEQVIHAHRTSYRTGWQWFGELTPILTFDQYLLLYGIYFRHRGFQSSLGDGPNPIRYDFRVGARTLRCRAFSLTCSAAMQIYWNKRKLFCWFGTPAWPPFHCFGTPIWWT